MEQQRKDWIGRTPRWRVSMDDARFGRIIEAFEFFITQKGLWDDLRYVSDLELLKEARAKMATPLVSRDEALYMPLFDSEEF